MTAEDAIRIVAQRAVVRVLAFRDVADWADFPEIGEFDWERVETAAATLVADVPQDQFDEAYELLASRAEKDTA